MYSLSFYYNSDGSEPRPGLGFFSGLRLELKGRVQTQLFEKGLENCSFYIIKIRGPSKLRLLARPQTRLTRFRLGLGSIF